jgi:hypothetical protein
MACSIVQPYRDWNQPTRSGNDQVTIVVTVNIDRGQVDIPRHPVHAKTDQLVASGQLDRDLARGSLSFALDQIRATIAVDQRLKRRLEQGQRLATANRRCAIRAATWQRRARQSDWPEARQP